MSWKPTIPEPKVRLSREEKKAQTREALLAAAHQLFATKGYEATTIEEIASTAGFTRGAFYANFGNKDATMEALIAGGFADDVEAIDPIGESPNLEEMKK